MVTGKARGKKIPRSISIGQKLQDYSDWYKFFLFQVLAGTTFNRKFHTLFIPLKEKEQPLDGLIAVTIALINTKLFFLKFKQARAIEKQMIWDCWLSVKDTFP